MVHVQQISTRFPCWHQLLGMFANVALPLKLSVEEISSLFGEIVSKKQGFGWFTYDEFSKRIVSEIKDASDIGRIVTEILKSRDAEKLDTLIEYIEHLSRNTPIKDEWVYTDKSGTPTDNSYNAVLQMLLAFTSPQHYTPNAPQMEEVTLNDFMLRDYWLDDFSPLRMYLAIDDSVGEIDRLFEWAKDQKPKSSEIKHLYPKVISLCDSSACVGGCWCCESIFGAILSKSTGSEFFGRRTIDWLMREDASDFDEEENDPDCICEQRVNTLMNVLERVVVTSGKIYLSTRHRMISDCIKEANKDNLPLETDFPKDGGKKSVSRIFEAMTEQLASKYEGVKPDYTVIVKGEEDDDDSEDGETKKCDDDDDSDKKCEDDGSPKSKRVCV